MVHALLDSGVEPKSWPQARFFADKDRLLSVMLPTTVRVDDWIFSEDRRLGRGGQDKEHPKRERMRESRQKESSKEGLGPSGGAGHQSGHEESDRWRGQKGRPWQKPGGSWTEGSAQKTGAWRCKRAGEAVGLAS